MNNTLDFYENNWEDYIKRTKDLNIDYLLERFCSKIPKGGHILDLGCGSGRDSFNFYNKGFSVTSVDFCLPFIENIGNKNKDIKTCCVDIMDLKPDSFKQKFDGVWSMASLLHLTKKEIYHPINCFQSWLKEDGEIFIALKSQENKKLLVDEKRHFSFYEKNELAELFFQFNFKEFSVEVGDDCAKRQQQWLNCWISGVKVLPPLLKFA